MVIIENEFQDFHKQIRQDGVKIQHFHTYSINNN